MIAYSLPSGALYPQTSEYLKEFLPPRGGANFPSRVAFSLRVWAGRSKTAPSEAIKKKLITFFMRVFWPVIDLVEFKDGSELLFFVVGLHSVIRKKLPGQEKYFVTHGVKN